MPLCMLSLFHCISSLDFYIPLAQINIGRELVCLSPTAFQISRGRQFPHHVHLWEWAAVSFIYRHVIGENKNQWHNFPKIKKFSDAISSPPPLCAPSPQHLVLTEGWMQHWWRECGSFILPIKLYIRRLGRFCPSTKCFTWQLHLFGGNASYISRFKNAGKLEFFSPPTSWYFLLNFKKLFSINFVQPY